MSASRKHTLAQSIERLARETGATDRFVERVRRLFRGRGIDLEREAGPYDNVLREAFRRHAEARFEGPSSPWTGEVPEVRFRLVRGDTDLPYVPGPTDPQ